MLAAEGAKVRQLADVLDSFVLGDPCFKAIDGLDGAVISCDPLEVADALGCSCGEGAGVAAEAVREAMDGLCQAHFGRSEQARLAVLAAALLSEAYALRDAGLTPWVVRAALRRSERIAGPALDALASKRLAEEVLDNFVEMGTVDVEKSLADFLNTPSTKLLDLPLHFETDDGEENDEVDWFFRDDPPALPTVTVTSVAIDAVRPQPSAPTPTRTSTAAIAGSSRTFARGVRDIGKDLDDTCRELRRRSLAAAPSSASLHHGLSESRQDEQCFVYASRRSQSSRPDCMILGGVVCHVVSENLVANGSLLRRLQLRDHKSPQWQAASASCASPSPVQLRRALFIDADLTGAGGAYESFAPGGRRIVRDVIFTPPSATELGSDSGAAFSALPSTVLPDVSRDLEARLGDAVRRLCSCRGLEALFLAGMASPGVAAACRSGGVLLVCGVPSRTLHALAEEARAEVLRGLPASNVGSEEAEPPWESKVPLVCELRELTENERWSCFSFPLFGYRQPLLPHQVMVGEDTRGSCWELRASACQGSRSHTVLLEASCEPTLRQLHAELGDRLFVVWRESNDADGDGVAFASGVCGTEQQLATRPQTLPGRGAWALAIADALEEGAAKEAQQVEPRVVEAEPVVAPWLAPAESEDSLACAAALERFAKAFRDVGHREAARVAACSMECESDDGCGVDWESLSAIKAVLRRTAHVVDMLINLDNVGVT
eukprot:TRINITY_DN44349_c0_g1_i1.p1 TRINITY_DN44349_c0_g1~~TRINITY_DN44349_c0_g1_i1.p1  ORF type:complete len:720 (-),score=146.32 TRINITY_DN44349_c0_g1_i1:68-2227(-)